MQKRILHIDDDELIREYLADFISGFYPEIEVSSYESWSIAKAHIASGENFDLILLDEVMPDINGIEIYKQICDNYPAMRETVVFLAGSKRFIDTERPFIKKPFDISEMHKLIQSILPK